MASWEVCIDSMGHSIRVAEGRGGGWLHGRYALTPWDTAPELLKVEGEGGFMGGPWDTASELLKVEGEGGFMGGPWDTASELLKVEGEGGFMGGMH